MKSEAGPDRHEFQRRLLHASRELAKYAAKVATRFVPGGVLREEDVDGILTAISSGADDELFQFINTFESQFDALVREYVGADGYLVVFIDDLDRCLPENAIEVVEALKLYLDRASCVFVVGAQPDVIEEAVRRRYKDSPALAAVEYL
jgi:KAP family P-loop domain